MRESSVSLQHPATKVQKEAEHHCSQSISTVDPGYCDGARGDFHTHYSFNLSSQLSPRPFSKGPTAPKKRRSPHICVPGVRSSANQSVFKETKRGSGGEGKKNELPNEKDDALKRTEWAKEGKKIER